ncbi:MAG: hypothetical protein ABR956_16575 [Terracidiphilus sp.]
MNRAITLAQLRPAYESFPWSDAPQVIAGIEAGGHFGKIVLTVN